MASTQKQKKVSGGSVTGSLNALILGSIAHADFWFGGRRRARIISPSFTWPVLNSSLLRYWFSDKLLDSRSCHN